MSDQQYPYPSFPADNNQEMNAYQSTDPMTQGTGKAKATQGLGWGFKATFQSPGAWLGFTFLAGTIIIAALGALLFYMYRPAVEWMLKNNTDDLNAVPAHLAPPNQLFFTIPAALLTAIITPLFISTALKAVNGERITFGDFFRPKHPQWTFIAYFVFYLIYFGINELAPQQSPGEFNAMTGLSIVSPILAVLITPLLMLIPYVWQDSGCGFAQGISTGFQAGARNYLPLLGFILLMTLISLVAMIPLGLGMIVVVPAQALGTAFLYRQATGGLHPQTD